MSAPQHRTGTSNGTGAISTSELARWLRHERGFSVIPLDHPDAPLDDDPRQAGKRPVVPWMQFQYEHPTDQQLARWFGSGLHRNLGIVTGSISGVVVVDCDSREAEAYAAANIPPTPMATRTGSGGVHLFYKHPGGSVRNRARLRTANGVLQIDVRADGGYVVAPTSRHWSGRVYERIGAWPPVDALPVFDPAWLQPELPPAPACPVGPPLSETSDVASRMTRAAAYLATMGPAVEGSGGDAHTFRAAAVLVKDFALADSEAFDLLSRWNQTCVPPWPARELQAKIEHARKYGHHSIGAAGDRSLPPRSSGAATAEGVRSPASDGQHPDDPGVSSAELEHDSNAAGASPRPKLMMLCMADVVTKRVEWAWENRLALGMFQALIGDGGVGKSTLALDIAARITRGDRWPDGGYAPKGYVALLSNEDSPEHTIKPRLEQLGADCSKVLLIKGTLGPGGEVPFVIERDIPALREALHEYKPVLLIIDPLSAYFGTDRDSYKDPEVRAVLGPLVGLAAETGTAVLGLIHLNKASGQKALYRVMGSQAFAATARIVLAAGKDPNDETRRYLVGVKENICQRAPALEYRITDAEGFVWTAEPPIGITADKILSGHTAPHDADHEDVVEFLRNTLAGGPLPAPEVERLGKDAGFTASRLRRAKPAARVVSKHLEFGGGWIWRLQDADADTKMLPKAPKVTRSREGVILGENSPASPLQSTPFPKMTDVSSSASSWGAVAPSQPAADGWGEV